MTLVNLFSAEGFNAMTSLVVVALGSSYTISLACLIYHRACGRDLPSDRRFSLGRAGLPINIVACLFVAFISVFSV
jgi:choline transport protein